MVAVVGGVWLTGNVQRALVFHKHRFLWGVLVVGAAVELGFGAVGVYSVQSQVGLALKRFSSTPPTNKVSNRSDQK